MTDRDILIEKTNSIQNCLKRIHDTVRDDPELETLNSQDVLVLNLQRAIQLTLDMAAHIISSERLGIPKSLKETFQILEQNRYIDQKLSAKLQKMVGFRNIAVHDYQALNLEILKKIITHHLGDFQAFYREIIKKIK
jgi:uncharacterized protein YutE (UPF0331/DUF86 family)